MRVKKIEVEASAEENRDIQLKGVMEHGGETRSLVRRITRIPLSITRRAGVDKKNIKEKRLEEAEI